FYAKAPSFAGGDLDKSKQHFERAIELEPNYLGTKVLYAEYYAPKREDKELFTRLLNEVAGGDVTVLPGLEPEQTFEQKKAERLLSEVDEIF
ncbi:MAG: TRAP transporter TatT component family protein, partial [Myxococcota bacterium]